MEVRAEDQHLLTLNTHKGLYRCNRLMYGIASAPAIWQRNIESILKDIPGVTVFLDDIRVAGKDTNDHLQRLEAVFKRLQKYNIKINLNKSEFFKDQINYCGYVIDRNGLHKARDKIEAINKMQRPRNITEDCESSFQVAKRAFTSPKCLVHFDPTLHITLATDASPYGVGAVLSHVYPDGTERVIQYASQTLSDTQKSYSQIDKEAYAIIFGFNYSIKYRKSELHANADCLSRLPVKNDSTNYDVIDIFQLDTIETLPITITDLKLATQKDTKLSKVYESLASGKKLEKYDNFQIDTREFTLQNGIILRGHRTVIPQALRKKILQELHLGHFGVVRMKNLTRGYVWWPNIDQDIEALTKNCKDCNAFRNNPTKIEAHIWEPTTTPFERVHVDFAGPFLGCHFFILVDTYTKWPEIHIVKNLTSKTTIDLCRKIFATFGIPKYFVSDNAKTFTATEFKTFLKVNGITQKLTAPYNPSTNGQTERFVQTLKNSLRCMRSNSSNMHILLQQILMQYRNTSHAATGKSPAELMFARRLRTRLDLLLPTEKECIQTESKPVPIVFEVGKRVSCRNYLGHEKWCFGKVKERIGKLHYQIQLDDGRIWKRHINQMRAIGEKTPAKMLQDIISSNDFTIDNTPPEIERPLQQAPEEPEHLQQELHQQTIPVENSNETQENLPDRATEPIVETPTRVSRSPRRP
ncbi:PREDICTED: uncharacterized protein K02A2.6-like, partial [Vollenhovia emeryi]|uniref:uncharacterized protein K02A2.6-like n=1 Tax=Vollenhovia emeryi TaxID=411798 RepID=UPI0005F58007